MRTLLLIFLALFPFCGELYASDNGAAIVSKMLSKVEDMNRYKVNIEVVYGDSSIPGFYEVDGDSYYISIDQQELYGDLDVKYEIYNSRKEVIIDKATSALSGNILDNPATAFAAIRDNYSPVLVSENKDVAIVNLKQSSSNGSNESIELHISKVTSLPTTIVYKFDDEAVQINIVDIDDAISTITLYNASKYIDYEIIDFR